MQHKVLMVIFMGMHLINDAKLIHIQDKIDGVTHKGAKISANAVLNQNYTVVATKEIRKDYEILINYFKSDEYKNLKM